MSLKYSQFKHIFHRKTESYLIVSFNRGHIAAGSNVISDFDMATYKGVIRRLIDSNQLGLDPD